MKIRLQYLSPILLALLFAGCARNPSGAPQTVSMPPKPDTTNRTALAIYDKLPLYQKAAEMPWAPLQLSTPVKYGTHGAYMPELRKRLIALNDYPSGQYSDSSMYGNALAHAISQFQYENGLSRTGIINQATLDALNIPPAARFNTLVDSMYEWAKYPENGDSRYVLVNIPGFHMHLISQGQEVLTMKVIVGRPSRPTPTLSSEITTIVFNPTWTVPPTILAQDVIPGMRKNPNFLKTHDGLRVYASWKKDAPEINPASIDWQTASASTFPYRVTAPPSDINPLGRVKFLFHNTHDVYMHGTPAHSLFNLTVRARSSGCVRLQDPVALVQYFYQNNTDLDPTLTQQYLSTYDTKYVQLRYPMPVHITYILASVGPNGTVHFFPDIYRDSHADEGVGDSIDANV